MNQYLILHRGFEMPSPEDMDAWKNWFGMVADKQVARGGLRGGKEITKEGTSDLPFGKDSLTGYTVIQAESFEAAEEIARACPVVVSTSVYEIK